MQRPVQMGKSIFSRISNWVVRRGPLGFVAVGIAVAVAVSSGVGVTMAATGNFQASKPSNSPVASQAPTPSPTETYGYSADHQVTVGTENNPNAGNGFVSFGEGLKSIIGSSGVQFSFRGPCQPTGMTVKTNTGLIISTTGTCPGNNPQGMAVSATFNWQGNFTHFCMEGTWRGSSAVRAEIGSFIGEWIAIPSQYINCNTPSNPAVPNPAPAPPAPAVPVATPSTSSSPSATSAPLPTSSTR